MIAIDPTEARENSRLPNIPGAVIVPDLEKLTGADLMISSLDLPAGTERLIAHHISEGAVLVQRKSGRDLIESLGARLNDAQERMSRAPKKDARIPIRNCQKILLWTGTLTYDVNLMAYLNGQPMGRAYWGVVAALARWNDRGGVVENLINDELIPDWCVMRQRHLKEYAEEAGTPHAVYPELELYEKAANDPMQQLTRVRDGRLTLVSLPGIGPELANNVWEWSGKNLLWAIEALTSPETATRPDKPEGIGPKKIETIRKHFGYDVDDAATGLEKAYVQWRQFPNDRTYAMAFARAAMRAGLPCYGVEGVKSWMVWADESYPADETYPAETTEMVPA